MVTSLINRIISVAKKVLDEKRSEQAKAFYLRIAGMIYSRQKLVEVTVGNVAILVPKSHILIRLLDPDSSAFCPYRDMALGVISKEVSKKCPEGTIVDVGANVGDTAAIISEHASNPLILVEPSKYFYTLLESNVKRLLAVRGNDVRLEKVLVSDGSKKRGAMSYWGGTAHFVESKSAGDRFDSKTLGEISGKKAELIKIDTDGDDCAIILSSLGFLADIRPILYFELEIPNDVFFDKAKEVFSRLSDIGYMHITIWDARGFHLASISDMSVLSQLIRYLFKESTSSRKKCMWGYDIMVMTDDDKDVFESVRQYYERY